MAKQAHARPLLCLNRGDRIRTCDHLHPIQVRYQAALRPDASLHSSRDFDFQSIIQVLLQFVKWPQAHHTGIFNARSGRLFLYESFNYQSWNGMRDPVGQLLNGI